MFDGIRTYSTVFQNVLQNGRIPYKIFVAPRIHTVGRVSNRPASAKKEGGGYMKHPKPYSVNSRSEENFIRNTSILENILEYGWIRTYSIEHASRRDNVLIRILNKIFPNLEVDIKDLSRTEHIDTSIELPICAEHPTHMHMQSRLGLQQPSSSTSACKRAASKSTPKRTDRPALGNSESSLWARHITVH